MKLNLKPLFTLLFLATQLGCGSSNKDSKEIMVDIGIPVRAKSAVNLSNNLMSLFSVNIGYDCYQDQVYLILHDPTTEQITYSQKVKLRSIYSPAPVPAITYGNATLDVSYAINHIVNYSYLDEPLKITVPKGTPVDVGFIGIFNNPLDTGLDGICDQYSGSLAVSSSAMFGHALIGNTEMKAGSVALSIDVMHTNPSTAYTLSGYGDRYKNWVQLGNKFTYTGVGSHFGYLKTVSMLDGKIKYGVDSNSGAPYYVPHLFPITLGFSYAGGSGGCSVGSPCNAMYKTVVSGSGSTINPTIDALASPTPFGTPFNTFPGSPVYSITTY